MLIKANSKLNILHACGLSGHSPFLSRMQRLLSVMLTHALTQYSEVLNVAQVIAAQIIEISSKL